MYVSTVESTLRLEVFSLSSCGVVVVIDHTQLGLKASSNVKSSLGRFVLAYFCTIPAPA